MYDARNISSLAKSYFSEKENSYWLWREKGQVLETDTGLTICYREDLVELLRSVPMDELPPLSVTLLLIFACSDSYAEAYENNRVVNESKLIESLSDYDNEVLQYHFQRVTQFLGMINALRPELRKGHARSFLISEVCNGMGYSGSHGIKEDIISVFSGGSLDEAIFETGPKAYDYELGEHLKLLSAAADRFASSDDLGRFLETGVNGIDEELEIELPEVPQTKGDLFDELDKDAETSSLADLAKFLVGVLMVPMYAKNSSDRPMGGISDISNRGDFDKLLLSELAYDDDLLTARLVNREALYLKREEPPVANNDSRLLLVDATLRMWGKPRFLAIAAVLALIKSGEGQVDYDLKVLEQYKSTALELNSKENVFELMRQLNLGLHCGIPLIEELTNNGYTTPPVLITSDKSFESRDFLECFSKAEVSSLQIITVNRFGELCFFEWIEGQRKMLAETKVDLNKFILSNKKSATLIEYKEVKDLIESSNLPLLFPVTLLKLDASKSAYFGGLGLIGVTSQKTVLWVSSHLKGAYELTHKIEGGKYCFGHDGDNLIYILVLNTQQNLLKLYSYNIASATLTSKVSNDPRLFDLGNVRFDGIDFYLHSKKPILQQGQQLEFRTFQLHMASMTLEPATLGLSEFNALPQNADFQGLQNLIGNGYSVLFKVDTISMSSMGRLRLGRQELQIKGDSYKFDLVENLEVDDKKAVFENIEGHRKARVKKAVWEDGTVAVMDRRGFLYLQSPNKDLPIVIITLIVNKRTAACTTTGICTGSNYFLKDECKEQISIREFDNRFLQPILNGIKS